jgi:hypothetical protein
VVWSDAIFRDPPGWVRALMLLRNAAVGLVGIERGDSSAFDVLARSEREAVVGTDAGHLDFRASILVDRGRVTLSTIVHVHNRRGRLYLRAVRLRIRRSSAGCCAGPAGGWRWAPERDLRRSAGRAGPQTGESPHEASAGAVLVSCTGVRCLARGDELRS